MKETFYFSHDYNARHDPKIVSLRMKYKMEGVGIYWCLVEMLYEQGGFISLDECESIAFELRMECDRIKEIINAIFEVQHNKFYAKSVLARLKTRKGKSEKARQSALLRWNKEKNKNADAMRSHSDRNAIKESKVKESKVKESNIGATAPTPKQIAEEFFNYQIDEDNNWKKHEFYLRVETWAKSQKKLQEDFTAEEITAELEHFYNHWNERTPNGKKALWETKKTFEINRRIFTWFKNKVDWNPKINKSKNPPTYG